MCAPERRKKSATSAAGKQKKIAFKWIWKLLYAVADGDFLPVCDVCSNVFSFIAASISLHRIHFNEGVTFFPTLRSFLHANTASCLGTLLEMKTYKVEAYQRSAAWQSSLPVSINWYRESSKGQCFSTCCIVAGNTVWVWAASWSWWLHYIISHWRRDSATDCWELSSYGKAAAHCNSWVSACWAFESMSESCSSPQERIEATHEKQHWAKAWCRCHAHDEHCSRC